MKAFTESLPEGEDWYEKRMAICETCPLNSKNMAREQLSGTDKVKIDLNVCPEGDHCTACGCCTHRKASQKSETCGKKEIGEEPLWVAVEVESVNDKKVTIENITPDIGNLIEEENTIIFDAGETSKERVDFILGVNRKGNFELKNVRIGCKCTVAEPEKISDNHYKFNIALSTKDFRQGANVERSFVVEYYGDKNEVSEITVKIKLKKL